MWDGARMLSPSPPPPPPVKGGASPSRARLSAGMALCTASAEFRRPPLDAEARTTSALSSIDTGPSSIAEPWLL